VLAAIPYRDRLSQIDALSAKLVRRFGTMPRGANSRTNASSTSQGWISQ